MIECPIYYSLPTDEQPTSEPPEEQACDGCNCNCGYLQFESLAPYMAEIKDSLKEDPKKAIELEFKLRERIVEISRIFDNAAGVNPGYFSKAHNITTEIFATNGTRYIKIPDFVKGTLEVRSMDNVLLNSDFFGYQNGYLVYLPCATHNSCECSSSCGGERRVNPAKWPDGCYKVTARWGKECADKAVQAAIRDYLIESYRLQDPVQTIINGIPISRTFKVPHSWNSYIENFKNKRRIHSQWAIA